MKKVIANTKKDGRLIKGDKIQVILLLIFNTLWSFLIYYFGWKEKLPVKAKQVKTYLIRIVLILLAITLIAGLGAVILIAINPSPMVNNY